MPSHNAARGLQTVLGLVYCLLTWGDRASLSLPVTAVFNPVLPVLNSWLNHRIGARIALALTTNSLILSIFSTSC
jgi:hypothetical protein